jgi:ribose transport system ATP-binding protein
MLEIRSVSKSFPGVKALQNVTFQVQTGEVHAVIGENGAGKSTLMKILSGVYTDYEGEIFVNSKRLMLHDPHDAQQHGIAIIHQELNLIPELTIAENIFLGREMYTPIGLLDTKRMETEAAILLARLNLKISPDHKVRGLRMGEQQLVEIAKAFSLNANLLILDEPTSALSETEIERLFSVIESLKQIGVTMIYISHKLDEIFQISDHVTVLRDGQYIGTRETQKTDQKELIRMMVGRSLNEMFPKQRVEIGNVLLRVDNLCLLPDTRRGTRSLKDISFTLRKGEIIGVAGLMGAGRTELLEAIFGVYPPSRVLGHIVLHGNEHKFANPKEAINGGLAFVNEDRKTQSLILKMSVANNITLAALGQFLRFQIINQKAENKAISDSIEHLRIKTSSPNVLVDKLSGGNQQKVALAKCLLTKPDVLLLDEPTHGIDIGAKYEIYTLMGKLVAQGASIIMASSELPEILAVCDRILVLCEGRLTSVFNAREATQELIMEAATTRQPVITPINSIVGV